jgi:hypothetical protein
MSVSSLDDVLFHICFEVTVSRHMPVSRDNRANTINLREYNVYLIYISSTHENLIVSRQLGLTTESTLYGKDLAI